MNDDDNHKPCTLDLNLQLGLGFHVEKNVNKSLVNSKNDLAFELSLKRGYVEEQVEEEDEEIAINTSNDGNGCSKKLRLTKEQSTMLEDAFKLHNTINTVIYFSFNFFLYIFNFVF